MAAKNKPVEDVEFIFEECLRYQRLTEKWMETREYGDELKEAFLCELRHPTDSSKRYTCGRAAMIRLEELARLALKSARMERDVSLYRIREELGKILVRRFVVNSEPIDSTHVARALGEVARKAKSTRKDIAHFIPCHLMFTENPGQFAVGPVTFVARRTFRRRLAQLVRAVRRDSDLDYRFLREVTRYYKTFGWIAVVTPRNCDEATSKAVAQSSVVAALNCLHLLFGQSNSARMRTGGAAITRDSRGGLTMSDGKLECMASYAGMGEVAFPEDWIKFFDEPDHAHLLTLFGVALESAVKPSLERPLSERFLDAALWYGEAVRETSQAARVIKYVTALERMLMTDNKDDISATVSQRVAAICYDPGEPSTHETWRKDAQKAYTLRSKLAHGSLSPKADEVFEGVRLSSRVGQAALLSALSAFGVQGLTAENVSRRNLAQWFDNIVSDTQQRVAASSNP